MAVLLLADSGIKRDRGEAPDRPTKRDFPMPVEVDALLRRYFRPLPWPAKLFDDPYAEIAGDRVLGRWFAGQLLDSALFRALAACDRLAILLWANAELPLKTRRDGEPIHPSFRRYYLNQLTEPYGQHPAWEELVSFADDELFRYTKNIRDGFTHSRRMRSQLHGDYVIEYLGDEERGVPPTAAIDAVDHVALALACYDGILRPLVRLTGEVLPQAQTSGLGR